MQQSSRMMDVRTATGMGQDVGTSGVQRPSTILEGILWEIPSALAITRLRDQRILRVNPSFVRLLGYAEGEAQALCDCGAGLYVNPQDRERLLARAQAVAEVGSEIVALRAKDGSRRIVQFAVRSLQLDGEECVLSHIVDLTGEWEMNDRLRQSEERYRRLFEEAPDAICVLDGENGTPSRIVDCNAAMVALFGYTREEIVRMTPTQLVMNLPPEREDAIVATLREGKVDVSNFVGRTKDGRRVETENRSVGYWRDDRLSVLVFVRDLTQQREAERALRLNEESIRAGLRDMGIMLFRQDSQLRYTWFYDSEKGYLSDIMLGTTDRTWLKEAEAQEREQWKRTVLASGHATRFTLARSCTDTDERRLFDYILEPVRDDAGQTIGLTGSALDVTERERVRSELLVARDLFEHIANAAPVGIFRAKADGCMTYVNDEAERFSGRGRAQLLQLTLMDLVPGWDLANTVEEWGRITNDRHDFAGEACILLPDGRERWGLVHVRPLAQADGSLEIIGSVTDITDRMRERQVLQALVEARLAGDRFFPELLRRIAEMLSVEHAYLVECEGTGGSCRRLRALWSDGADLSSQQEWTLPDDCPGDHAGCGSGACGRAIVNEGGAAGTSRRWAPGAQVRAAATLRAKDGRILGVIGVMSEKALPSVPEADFVLARVSAALASDLEHLREQEERRRVEAQLYQSQKLEALGSLAGGIAHDFNNILTAVLNYTMLARDASGDSSTGEVSQYLGEVMRAGNRARSLVKQILAFSRPEGRSKAGSKQAVDLAAIVSEVLTLIRPTVPASIELKQVEAESVPPVCGDSAQIHQVVLNLCVNAVQAMRGRVGEVRIVLMRHRQQASTSSAKLLPGRYVCAQIEDQGVGIEPQALSRIFDPFYTTKAASGGSGLGLAVAQGIVANLGGAIEVRSVVGAGTAFRFYLPESIDRATPVVNPVMATVVRGRGQRIMLVDDDSAALNSLTLLLRRSGYNVASFSVPEEALAAVWAAPDSFDVLITDHQMPKLTGIMLAERARTACPNLPVILMSGHLREVPDDLLDHAMLTAVLEKPVPLEQMTTVISRALHASRA